MGESVDVLVLGAGPAGATIARLLAARDYTVLLLKGAPPRNPNAETLPPSTSGLFEAIGAAGDIREAGFYPNLGITRWWSGEDPCVESYEPGPSGYHVERRRFDELLVSLAERAGATVQRNNRAPRVVLEVGAVEHDGGISSARFIVDATGRAGLLARQIKRYWDPRYRTCSLCAIVRAGSPWDADPHHHLIEAHDRGWASSVPLALDRRSVSFMMDASAVGAGGETAFRGELERTFHFHRLFADSKLEGPPWIRDGSLYSADRYAGPKWILVGDAGSFVDTLTSFSTEKAIMSAVRGAEVVSACLDNPRSATAAIEEFNVLEQATWLRHTRRASLLFGEGAELFHTPFWRDRAAPPDMDC